MAADVGAGATWRQQKRSPRRRWRRLASGMWGGFRPANNPTKPAGGVRFTFCLSAQRTMPTGALSASRSSHLDAIFALGVIIFATYAPVPNSAPGLGRAHDLEALIEVVDREMVGKQGAEVPSDDFSSMRLRSAVQTKRHGDWAALRFSRTPSSQSGSISGTEERSSSVYS